MMENGEKLATELLHKINTLAYTDGQNYFSCFPFPLYLPRIRLDQASLLCGMRPNEMVAPNP